MNDKKKIQNVMDKIPVNKKLEERLLAMKEGKANEIFYKNKASSIDFPPHPSRRNAVTDEVKLPYAQFFSKIICR